MRSLIPAAILLSLAIPAVLAQDKPNPPMPAVEQAIPPAVKALGAPTMLNFDKGIRMAVSAKDDTTQQHVLQGLNHLHSGWEFEACRHFAAAMTRDPDCLMAQWGMVMALLDASPEDQETRLAGIQRLIHLINQGRGTELERQYALGTLSYLKDGPAGAAKAFRSIADQYPNELQAAVFAALFNRDGYDINGIANEGQVESEKQLLALCTKFPDSTIPIHALLVIRGEAPKVSESLELARRLSQMQPDYPPIFHLLGHYEWRNGHHARAVAAFGKAAGGFQRWMRANQAGVADCPEWAKAECYRVVALLSMGDFETAYAAARQVAATPIPEERLASDGARFLLWDAKTLPARILLHRGLDSDAAKASLTLPTPDEIKPYLKSSLAYWWIDGLRICLEAQRLLADGKPIEARQVAEALNNHIGNLESRKREAWTTGEGSQWLRSFRALKVLHGELRGKIAQAGPKNSRATAYNWFASGMEFQRHEPMLYPPMVLTPMAARMGNDFLHRGETARAVEYYLQALQLIPEDIHSLIGLKSAYTADGKTEQAAAVGERISKLRDP